MFDTVISLCKEWSLVGICIRLFLATLAGVIIGMDRESKNKGAGIKTHALVCIGAAMAMIINEYVLHTYPDSNTDLTRIGAQVISGIGFLGVGTIMVTGRNEVKGLTTAAGLWACAGIGLAAGIGFIEGTLIAMVFVILVLRVLNPIDLYLRQQARDFEVYVEVEDTKVIKQVLLTLRSQQVGISNFHTIKEKYNPSPVGMTMSLTVPHHGQRANCLLTLRHLEGVNYVEEI